MWIPEWFVVFRVEEVEDDRVEDEPAAQTCNKKKRSALAREGSGM